MNSRYEGSYREPLESNESDFNNDEFLLAVNEDASDRKQYNQQEYIDSARFLENDRTSPDERISSQTQGFKQSDLVQKEETKKVPSLKCYIYAWGKNESGELSFGNQKQASYNRPENPKNLDRVYISQISTSQNHSACISSNGELYVCGSALHGKLGLEDLTMANINKFQIVPIFKGIRVLQMFEQNWLNKETDQVYSWGGTLHKKVGQRSGKPAPISHLNQKGVIMVDCGDYHSVALTSQGELYSWGGGGQDYNKGQLGLGHAKDIENPEKIRFFEGKKVVNVSCGQFHTLALTSDNEIFGWGAGEFGELGSLKFKHEYSPLKIKINFNQYNILYENILFETQIQSKIDYTDTNPQIVDIKCGGHHSLILTNHGFVYSSGFGRQGQLGLRSTENQCEFQLVWSLTRKIIIQIAAGWNHSLVLSDKNDIFACGHGAKGQLGLGDDESKTIFTHVMSLGGKNTATISAGGDHSWAVLDQNFPIKENYRPPSPLRPLEQRSVSMNRSRDASPDLSMMKEGGSKTFPDDSKLIFEKILQVVYTEVDLCHRFVRFTLIDQTKPFKKRLDEYIEELKQFENGALLFSKYQNDEIILDENSNQINKQLNIAKNFTLMMISQPNRGLIGDNQQSGFGNTNSSLSQMFKSTSIGDMTLFKESDVNKDPVQQKLGYWFVLFAKKFKSIAEKMKFFELRPQALQATQNSPN